MSLEIVSGYGPWGAKLDYEVGFSQRAALPVIIGVILFAVASSLLVENTNEPSLQNFALGLETTSVFPKYNERSIHCLDIEGDKKVPAPPAMRCVESWKDDGAKPVVLMLGNSQAHAINQFKPGDKPFSYLLHGRLESKGFYSVMFSQPNASLQEHYVLFSWLLRRLAVSTLVLPVVFDDTREDGIREGLSDAFNDPFVRKELSRTEIGKQLLANNGSDGSEDDLAGLNDTPQKIIESRINDWLDENWTMWKARKDLRGKLLTELFFFRNWVFGIDAQSKRKMIPGRYTKNLAALEAILQVCAKRNIRVLLYVAPLRNDVEVPYVEPEYNQFKQDVAKMAREYGAAYGNLEDLVPGNLWGSKDSTNLRGERELDFMHFQAGGHRLLADVIFNLLKGNHFLEDKP